MASISDRFGAELRAVRLTRHWSQERLARRAGLTRETVARLESGSRRPTADTVFRIRAALSLQPDALVPAWPEWNPIGARTYGQRSRDRRRELELSLADVAAAAGVSEATLSRFERGRGKTPSLLEQADDGEPVRLASDRLALALGFASLDEHERFCTLEAVPEARQLGIIR